MLLWTFLDGLFKVGRLTVIDPQGKARTFGGGEGPLVTIRLHDSSLLWRIPLAPALATGEAYMDGRLTVDDADIYDFLELFGRNVAALSDNQALGIGKHARSLLRLWHQYNPVRRARRNVAHHYDLSGELYASFLDEDRQYSCAYFRQPDDSLEVAQRQKLKHIAAKLMLKPGMEVLDIGCGWGGMALYLAEKFGVRVTGLTLAEEQLKVARARAEAAGLAGRVRFHLRDYREDTGSYDRIVSVGMFEHVGVAHYRSYFDAVRDRLSPDGVALIHTIGRIHGPGTTNPWVRKYIFPGGYVPALSEVLPAVERSKLWLADVEVLRLHYAETLRHWRARFAAQRDRIESLYDARFVRMWEFYLAGCEVSFRHLGCVVYQVQLTRCQEVLPLTRDYMVETERRLDKGRRGLEAVPGKRGGRAA